jgi:hypothetical protein
MTTTERQSNPLQAKSFLGLDYVRELAQLLQ